MILFVKYILFYILLKLEDSATEVVSTGGFTSYKDVNYVLQNRNFFVEFEDGSDFCKVYSNSDMTQEQQELDRSPSVLSEVNGIFLCYDSSNRSSYENLNKKWKHIIQDKVKSLENVTIIIMGCKSDLNRAIDTTLIKMISPYAEEECVTSAKTGDNIDGALSLMISCIMNRLVKYQRKTKPKQLDSNPRNVGTKPHTFKLVFLKSPTWCKFCEMFIWGVTSPQGYKCTECKYTVHKKCKDDVPFFCGIE